MPTSNKNKPPSCQDEPLVLMLNLLNGSSLTAVATLQEQSSRREFMSLANTIAAYCDPCEFMNSDSRRYLYQKLSCLKNGSDPTSYPTPAP